VGGTSAGDANGNERKANHAEKPPARAPLPPFKAQMAGVPTWQASAARALLDEAPSAYKPIDEVMAAQADLVDVVAELRQVANYKGVR
jgi:tRNA-splicing ligase RtcB